MSDQPNSNNANDASRNNNPRHHFWCHQCQREIEPVLAPNPTCDRCNSEFVEEIEADNDPREFVEHGGHDHETDEEFEEFPSTTNVPPGQSAPNDVLQLLQTMVQTLVGPNVPLRVETHTYGDSRDGGTTTTTTTATITTEDGNTTTFNDLGSDQRPNIFFTMGTGTHPPSGQEGADGRTPIHDLVRLIQRTFGEGGQQNNTNWMNFLNMVGDPRDYVWGPGGLDNIISQLMEQQAEQAPPPATDDIINNLPKVMVTKKQVAEEQLNCPVCKDDFNEDETATLLPCKHTFHDECIRPWLKVNGTCPVCRYSLVPQEEGNDQNQSGGAGNGNGNGNGNFNGNSNGNSNGNGNNGNFNFGAFNGNFNGNPPPSSSSQSSARLNLPGSYPSTQQQNGQQNRQNEEQQSHDVVYESLD